MRATLIMWGLCALVLTTGCASKPEPVEEKSATGYRHTFDFMWKNTTEELDRRWDIESSDRETRTIVAKWRERFHPMSHFGERKRLTITITGDDVEGYRVTAKEEAESNTEQVQPMTPEEADWDPKATDGGLARLFLTELGRRLDPDERWRDLDKR